MKIRALLLTAFLAAGFPPLVLHGETTPEIEIIDTPLPFFDDHGRGEVRDPRPDDVFPPLRLLLSKNRYWQQDGHLDVVTQLAPPDGVDLENSRLQGRLLDDQGVVLSEFSIDPIPGPAFVVYPSFPDDFEGRAELELAWLADGGEIAMERRPFRVEPFQAPVPAEGRVELVLPNEPGVSQENWPVTAGVPFPRGVLSDTDHLRLVDEDGAEIPVQILETARWSKFGPIKWVLCDFTVDLQGGPVRLFLEYGPDVRREMDRSAIVIEETGQFPMVRAGRLRLDEGLWYERDSSARQVLEPAALTGAFVEHEDGRVYRMWPAGDFEIEEDGSERVVIKTEGAYVEVGGDREFCQYVVRYIVHRDSPLIRIFHTWIFTGDGNHDRIASMGWEFPMASDINPGGFLTAFGPEGDWRSGDYLLQYDYDHFDIVTGEGVEEVAGGRAPGVAFVEGKGLRVYFGAKDFWQNYPSELEFDDRVFRFLNWPRHNRPAGHTFDKELLSTTEGPALSSAARYAEEAPDSLSLSEWKLNAVQLRFAHEGEVLDFRLPDAFGEDPIWEDAIGGGRQVFNYHWLPGEPETANAQGIARTEEFWLYVAPVEPREAAPVMAGLNDETLRAVVDPVWVAASGAFGDIHYQDWENFPMEEAVYEQVALAPPRWAERLGAYGMWIHGDVPAWNLRLPNKTPNLYRAYREGHHGWPYPWVPYARSGDSRLLKNVEASTRQMIDAYYCYYVDEDVARRVGPDKYRRPGRWERSLLPWAARAGTSTRGYTSHSDHFWHAWYLTGYYRGKDLALLWGEHTKQEESGEGRWFDRRRGPISHDRTRYALAVSYLDMYEATFDPWFLVACHAILEMNQEMYLQGSASRIDFWRPWARDFLRFTGSEEFEELYLTMVDDPTRWHHLRGSGWGGPRGGGTPRIEPHAYAWRLTGDEFHLQRVAGILDEAGASVFMADTPDYYTGYYFNGAQVQGPMWTAWYLRLFPHALAVIADAGQRSPGIGNMFQLAAERVRGDDDTVSFRIPTIAVRKEEGQPLPLHFGARWSSANPPAAYEITGPDGSIVKSGVWKPSETIELMLEAEAPAGTYRIDVSFESRNSLGLPLTIPNQPEVLILEKGRPFPDAVRHGRFAFLVPEGVESFFVEFPLDRMTRRVIRDPDGETVWSFDYHSALGERESVRAEIEVLPEQAGRVWLMETPHSSDGIVVDPQIPPVYAVNPGQWFWPKE